MKLQIDDIPESPIKVVRLSGRLDSYTNKIFEESIEKLFEKNHHYLVFDLSGLDYINSTGLGTIMAAYQRADLVNGFVAVCGAKGKVAMIFRITKVGLQIKIFEHEEEAVRAASEAS
ncbi:STAS domain-containing protein [candidate division CSSED10-310 bacterium]|uniref:Anti-sigma factor antagonist n=1 Tax=candidate division CSSED10-310 bacterium TaxID=2855610 RepID=A0ABV6YZ32_UNCC1